MGLRFSSVTFIERQFEANTSDRLKKHGRQEVEHIKS